MAYDYEIEYKQGKTNTVGDVLSRVNSSDIVIHALSSITTDIMDRIKVSWQQDA